MQALQNRFIAQFLATLSLHMYNQPPLSGAGCCSLSLDTKCHHNIYNNKGEFEQFLQIAIKKLPKGRTMKTRAREAQRYAKTAVATINGERLTVYGLRGGNNLCFGESHDVTS